MGATFFILIAAIVLGMVGLAPPQIHNKFVNVVFNNTIALLVVVLIIVAITKLVP